MGEILCVSLEKGCPRKVEGSPSLVCLCLLAFSGLVRAISAGGWVCLFGYFPTKTVLSKNRRGKTLGKGVYLPYER